MFFPIRTDRRLKSTPWVNYALIAANLLIFAITSGGPNLSREVQAQVFHYFLYPEGGSLVQYLTYQFLHNDWLHLLGNMLFLYIFGNGVEDRLGKVGYLFFYLAGGVVAGLGHVLWSNNPVLGASGSVAAVTGAYLALFPLSNVTIVYWFIVIGAFEVSSMVLILFRVAQDILFEFSGVGNVAYVAHLAGYAFGFAVCMLLLLGRVLDREPYDMLALIEQRRRRASFQKMTRDGFHPWDLAAAKGKGKGASGQKAAAPATPADTALIERRSRITAAIADHDLPAAARRYVELIEDHPDQVMSQDHQLDIANQLFSAEWYDKAAAAYELFLDAYRSYSQREHIQLVLGLTYARYLERPDRAKALLDEALTRLRGDDKALAEKVRAEIKT